MGNIEAHDFAPVRPDERKELNLSRKPTYKQYMKHLDGVVHEACLHELPYSLRDSICLYEIMKAAFNALTELPPELPLRLPHLRHLDLSHNQLTHLPCSFGLLFHLQTLLLPHNRLRQLPDTFTRLVKLEKIDLSHNLLRDLPDDLGEMENLQRLNVSDNRLRRLPLSLGNTGGGLCLLLAGGNRLESPPQAVVDEGSACTLTFLRRQLAAHRELAPPLPRQPLNEFPRCRGNQLHSPVSNPQSAHRQYIQEQTHTANTPSRCKTPLLPPVGASTLDATDLRDRIIGLIYGAALGDAVGLSTRWMNPDQCAFHYGTDTLTLTPADAVQDKHSIPWRPGDWTSNFDTFMLVLDSLIGWAGVVDELDVAKRLSAWSDHGFLELGDTAGIMTSSTITQVVAERGYLSDPHTTAAAVLRQHQAMENGGVGGDLDTESVRSTSSLESSCSDMGPVRVTEASSVSEFGTDNGAVVRAAALGIPSFHDLGEVENNSVRICRATHADPRCVASSVFVSTLVATMLQGRMRSASIHPGDQGAAVNNTADLGGDDAAFSWQPVVAAATDRSLAFLSNEKHREEFNRCLQVDSLPKLNAREKGEMSHTFKPVSSAVLAAEWNGDFREFVTQLAREGGDSSSNCMVGGAVLGVRTGYQRLPSGWLQGLRTRQVTWLNHRVNLLLDLMGLP